MSCKHEKIKSVNCVLYCMDCGATLPADFFTKKAEKPPADVKPDNSPAENHTGVEQPGKGVSVDTVPEVNTAPEQAAPAEVKQDSPADEKKKPGRPAKK